jgi:lipopolysaccharide/colanic/teichoic acid biosynthesis glycosyltransferase
MKKIRAFFDSIVHRQRVKFKIEIHSVDKFARVIDAERARSDRTGNMFSLVVFRAVNEKEGWISALNQLIEALYKRVRSIDEVGWFDAKSIGVLLPDTSSDGALNISRDVCNRVTNGQALFIARVYVYPSAGLSGLNEQFPNDFASNRNGNIADLAVKRFDKKRDEPVIIKDWKEAEERLGCSAIPVWKRGIDIFGAASGLILLAPLFGIIYILIKTVSPGPVFYKGTRVGRFGNKFKCLKFRTMHANAFTSVHERHVIKLMHSDKPFNKLDDNDPRIILFGKVLRKSGLDELPQLINILRGEMSFVGPRPDMPYSVRHYSNWQKKRFSSVPGLTGLWQVSGKNNVTFKEMTSLDITYINKRSFWLDMKILLNTPKTIFTQVFLSGGK